MNPISCWYIDTALIVRIPPTNITNSYNTSSEMPMDDYTHYHGESSTLLPADSIANLRFALIGNNDLKFRLASDENYLLWFSNQLLASLDSLVAADAPTLHLVNELHARILILRILVTFAGSPTLTCSDDKLDVATLRFCLPLLSDFIKYQLDTFLPRLMDLAPSGASEISEIAEVVDSMMCDSFHIILVLANSLKLALEDVSFDSIMRLLTTLLLIADGPGPLSKSSFIMEKVLIAGLEMVPYCLERGPQKSTVAYAEGLLAVTLTRLFDELLSMGSDAGTDSNAKLPDSQAELNRLTSLMVAVVQLLNYFAENGRKDVLDIERKFFTSTDIYKSILILLRNDGSNLMNVSALNLIRFYFTFSDTGSSSIDSLNFEKLFPRIIELLDYHYASSDDQPNPKYVQLPVTILSDLCLKNPEICVHLRNTNVDLKIMNELESLFGLVILFRQLNALKSAAQNSNKLADLTVLRKASAGLESGESLTLLLVQVVQLDTISNYLLLLSVFTSSNEEFRRRITSFKSDKNPRAGPNFLCLMIFEIVDDFRFLVAQILLNYNTFAQLQQQLMVDDKFISWFGSNIGVLFTLLENSIFSNTFYLVRSLSRSVSTLRTFFVDCNSVKSILDGDTQVSAYLTLDPLKNVESIVDVVSAGYDREITFERKGSFVTSTLEILSLLDNVHVVMDYFLSLRSDYDNQRNTSRKSLHVKKIILLASIANFILDFSSFRSGIINHENFLRDLAILYMNAIEAKRVYDYSELKDTAARDTVCEQMRIQLGVFQVVKNYLYNENEENREFLWDFFPLSLIFDKSLYGIIDKWDEDSEIHKLLLEHKIIAFEIMRNLTAASTYFSEAIKDSYLEYAKEKQANGQIYAPKSWNDYLHDNLMCYDLFVDLQGEEDAIERRFFTDDEFLLTLVNNSDYVRLVLGINYLEDHRYTNISEFRRSDFPRPNLLRVWKRILEVKLLDKLEERICGLSESQRVKLSNLLSEIKVSVNWILINLTYEDDEYGYLMPDKINFGLFDTVSSAQPTQTTNVSSRLFTPSNIVIEESDEEEEETQQGEPNSQDIKEENGILTPRARAKILNRQGFTNVLQKLIYEMSTPKYEVAKGNERSPLERFDNLNANDLYEKSKTAHYQIVSLLSGTADDQGKKFRTQQHAKSKPTHPLRRVSNIISSERNVFARDEATPEGASGSQSAEWARRNEEAVASGDDDEEIDEYWIR